MKNEKKQNIVFLVVLCFAIAIANLTYCEVSHQHLADVSLNKIARISSCQAEALDTITWDEYSPTRIPDLDLENLSEEELLRISRLTN